VIGKGRSGQFLIEPRGALEHRIHGTTPSEWVPNTESRPSHVAQAEAALAPEMWVIESFGTSCETEQPPKSHMKCKPTRGSLFAVGHDALLIRSVAAASQWRLPGPQCNFYDVKDRGVEAVAWSHMKCKQSQMKGRVLHSSLS
jgi:hypothetical protein